MKNMLRSLPVAAMLVFSGALLAMPLAPAQAQVLPPAQGIGEPLTPNDQYYADGYASGDIYLSVPRTTEEVGAELNKAYYLQTQGTTLREYYFMDGYIDRLRQY